ncbi:MAG: AMP-binding protein, partial [Terriglobales bacterium]
MLDLKNYSCLGAALRDALERWPGEVCLIEADRERENCRLTYRDFKQRALPLAQFLEDSGFGPGSRAAICMTNQSKWLISAYAIFYRGGVLVPLDYKLTGREQLELLAHSQAEVLVVEYHLWRAQMQVMPQAENFAAGRVRTVLVTEAPPIAELAGAQRWEDAADAKKAAAQPTFVSRERSDMACIVYSSGTGGRPKGCVLTHENYLEQCVSLT